MWPNCGVFVLVFAIDIFINWCFLVPLLQMTWESWKWIIYILLNNYTAKSIKTFQLCVYRKLHKSIKRCCLRHYKIQRSMSVASTSKIIQLMFVAIHLKLPAASIAHESRFAMTIDIRRIKFPQNKWQIKILLSLPTTFHDCVLTLGRLQTTLVYLQQ